MVICDSWLMIWSDSTDHMHIQYIQYYHYLWTKLCRNCHVFCHSDFLARAGRNDPNSGSGLSDQKVPELRWCSGLRCTALLDIRSVLSCRFCFSKLPHPTYTRPSLLNVIVTFLYIWYFRELFGKDELKFHQFEGWYATSGSEIIN